MTLFDARQAAASLRDRRGRGAGSPSPAYASEIRNAQARRIVTVGGALTEIVYALGLEDRLVGIDTTSLYPLQALQQKPNVGYMRQLSAEGVLGLNPELILATEGSGPKETLAVLGEAKVPIVTVPESFSEDGILERIRIVARELGAEAARRLPERGCGRRTSPRCASCAQRSARSGASCS